jgi:Generalcontrol nonderepressible 1 (Gcn1) N-terminal
VHAKTIERVLDTSISILNIIGGLPKISVDVSLYIVQSLHSMFAKETNETTISAMIEALMAHQHTLLRNNKAVDGKILDTISKGLTDKRNRVKSSWAVTVSEVILNIDDPSYPGSSAIAFSMAVAKNLFSVFNEVASNPLQASQNGTIISGYAISAAVLRRWFDWQDGQLGNSQLRIVLTLEQLAKANGILNITIAVTPKPSFLLNERIYTKLLTERDQLWAIRALEAVGLRALMEMEMAWPAAAIFFIVNQKLSRKVRFAAKAMVENVLLHMSLDQRSRGADFVISRMEEWLRQVIQCPPSADTQGC